MSEAWLQALQPGDKVIVVTEYREYIARIDRRTPSGRLVIGDLSFNPDGTERTDRDNFHRKHLREWSPALEHYIREEQLRTRLLSALQDVSREMLDAMPIAECQAWLTRLRELGQSNIAR